MKRVTLANGREVPALGLGTWKMGEDARHRKQEIAALRRGIDLGMTLIDTAEMYADGGAEEVVGEAIEGRRDEVFLVSKVYPQNAGRKDAIVACDRSLRRLGVDCIDLYLLHWRGSVPLAETFAVFEELKRSGKIGSYGVSNFDTSDMEEAWRTDGGRELQVNQILYNLGRRSPEFDLLPWCLSHSVAIMAYSPVEQGQLVRSRKLDEIAAKRKASAAQIALAWLLSKEGVIAIPKSASEKHVEENRGGAEIELTAGEIAALDLAFPRPSKRKPLEML